MLGSHPSIRAGENPACLLVVNLQTNVGLLQGPPEFLRMILNQNLLWRRIDEHFLPILYYTHIYLRYVLVCFD